MFIKTRHQPHRPFCVLYQATFYSIQSAIAPKALVEEKLLSKVKEEKEKNQSPTTKHWLHLLVCRNATYMTGKKKPRLREQYDEAVFRTLC